MHKFDTPDYLEYGNPVQQKAYAILSEHIMSCLAGFNPVLAGTIPLGIDIEGSDLDILCQWQDRQIFTDTVVRCFSGYINFDYRLAVINENETVVANFFIDGIEIEVFGQSLPVQQQNGYLHLVIEHEILLHQGEDFRQKIITLKQQGYKTEPAFARLLGLQGDPYIALLSYKGHK